MPDVRFLISGDCAMTVEFGNEISERINAEIRAFRIALSRSEIPGITETVPTYRSLMIHYDPGVLSYSELEECLRKLLAEKEQAALPPSDVVEIPVLYGGEMGPDLHFIAGNAGMSEEEVIRAHTSKEYLVYMLGFTPGFPYLGGMDESIAAPRLETPRIKIPAGSVGIAGKQTGVYPIDSPGGWRLIGRTPVKLYDPLRAEPILLNAGQYVRFRPITRDEYEEISAAVCRGTYRCRIEHRKEAIE